jgi:hypothetical protein
MPRYLLSCDCGNAVSVDVGQAGGHVACSCGKTLEVPTLRLLRHLPTEPSKSELPRKSWNLRAGVVAALLTPAILLGIAALMIRLSEPTVPPFDLQGMHEQNLKEVDRMAPAEWFQMWSYRYRRTVENGFSVYQPPVDLATLRQIDQKRLVQKVLLSLAAVFAGGALIAALWPRARTRTR